MKIYLAIGGAGFLGAVARYVVATSSARLFGIGFPWGTMIINVTGSFVLGWFYAAAGSRMITSETVRLAVATGFLGAYTTFSTYMFESDGLMRDGAEIKALFNLLGSVILGLLAVRLGWILGTR
jgi:CrcB protein